MMKDSEGHKAAFQRMICDCADELGEYWLAGQSREDIRDIMKLSICQKRMIRKIWRMTEREPDGVMLKDIAGKLSLSCSSVSVMVDAMVQRGILEREVSREDRRKVLIRISEKGMEFPRIYENYFNGLCAEFSSSQDPEDMRVFTAVLEKFTKFLLNKNEVGTK